jgi:membrane-associated phospholipid phosphatase
VEQIPAAYLWPFVLPARKMVLIGMRKKCFRFVAIVLSCGPFLALAFSFPANAQSPQVSLPSFNLPSRPILSPHGECVLLTRTMCDGLPSAQNRADNDSQQGPEHAGSFHRAATRLWRDQEELWTAPFKKSNLKWDAMVVLGTGALIATDRQTVPDVSQHAIDVSSNISNAAIYGTGTAAGSIWIAGLVSNNPHQKETGLLTLEALTDAMPVYTVLQVIAGRERPGEGTGNGRFWQKHSIDGSFPAGHAMFAWTMATVLAHEYPRWWARALFYGAAATVSVTRFTAHDHFAGDTFVGTALGYFIGRHIFHAHCNPQLSEACR